MVQNEAGLLTFPSKKLKKVTPHVWNPELSCTLELIERVSVFSIYLMFLISD